MQNNKKLFDGTAEYYSRYRPDYPEELIRELAKKFSGDGSGRLLDLGCGTGQLAIPLAPYFKDVVGVDPEKDMIEEAEKTAKRAGMKNIKFIHEKAENAISKLGIFRLVSIGRAFHWMEREIILEKTYNILEDGGGIAIIDDENHSNISTSQEDWKRAVRDILKKYLGEKRRAGNSFYIEPQKRHEEIMTHSLFKKLESVTCKQTRNWTTESLIGFLYSTSFAQKRFFGDRVGQFENEFKETLLKLKPSQKFSEVVNVTALIGWK
jgi:ubiquinone/menaquinone biosynthesis C-methylase UbiE